MIAGSLKVLGARSKLMAVGLILYLFDCAPFGRTLLFLCSPFFVSL